MSNTYPNPQPITSPTNGKSGRCADPENGYLLIGVLFLVALVLITLAVAAPRVASEIQRDKELELYHRGLQYQHAIRLYYKKFGRYPNNLEQLEKTNEIRFLRKRYKDPVTGKDEWRMIHFGEQKVKTTGLFGQPIAATGMNGLSTPGTPANGAGGSAFGSPSGSAFGSNSGSAFGSNSGSAFGSNSGSAFGSNSGSAFGSSGGSTSAFGGSTGAPTSPVGTGTTTATGTDTSAAGAAGTQAGATDPTAAGGASTGLAGASTSGISSIGSGQTFGGGGIVGVSSTSQKASIREYRKQKHYNEWEFVYDPASELNNMGGAAGAGQQNGMTNQNGSFGGGGFGSNGSNTSPGGFGSSSPTSPTSPQPPTQPTTPAPQQ